MSLSSPNQRAVASPNQQAYGSPNQAAYASWNQAAVGSGNQAALGSWNQAALGTGNQAAWSSGNQAAVPGAALPAALSLGPPLGATGAGRPSGAGFLGGYGPVARSDYATPASLHPLPWALDYSHGNGWPPFPNACRLNPWAFDPPLQWQVGDWDPGLRFWTLPFDPGLTEWLQDLDLSRPAVMAAREFAAQPEPWMAKPLMGQSPSPVQSMLDPQSHLGWLPQDQGGPQGNTAEAAWGFISNELVELEELMQDDRWRYLSEGGAQSADIGTYFVHLMAIDPASKPWTMELMNCATAIANLVKMQYKACYRRVRPSTVSAGLTPPWGPPQHPAFPSGHSLVAHLTALFLLSVPGIARRYGLYRQKQGENAHADAGKPWGTAPELSDFVGAKAFRYGLDQSCPLLWLAWRVARTRERLGLHYPSDSAASRRLAVGVWAGCLLDAQGRTWQRTEGGDFVVPGIDVPTLHGVLRRASAEWPDLTPAQGT